METALSTISVMPSGKKQVDAFVWQLKKEILSNDRDPLPVLVHLKYIEKTLENILTDSEVDDHFLRELQRYDKDEQVEINGAKLSIRETGVKYDYDSTGDAIWADLDQQIKELTEKKKEREKFLQSIPMDQEMVDPDTGTFIKRPFKQSKTKVIVKL